jgi:activator of 2-hydroxyglutaryl-CoA dehydratase
MTIELETKTSDEIERIIDNIYNEFEESEERINFHNKRWVSLESHEAAMKEAQNEKQVAYEAGRDSAKKVFKVLLVEQRKEIETDLNKLTIVENTGAKEAFDDSYERTRGYLRGKQELLVLLEERTK